MDSAIAQMTRNLLRDDPAIDGRIERDTETHRKGNVRLEITREGVPLPGARIRYRQIRHEFAFGITGFLYNQFDEKRQNERYAACVAELFNLCVLPFYWNTLEPEQGALRFEKNSPRCWRRPAIDELLEFCEQRRLTPKGHPLFWHNFLPAWLKEGPGLKAQWEQRFRIIAERYGERIRNWDIVNEALIAPPNALVPPDYVEFGFDLARKYLPAADICNYNDCLCWCNLRGRATAYYLLVKNLLLQNKKVDAIGLQFHLAFVRTVEEMIRWSDEKLNSRRLFEYLDLYHQLGLPMNLSEITITAHEALGNGRLDMQADIVEKLYRLWFSHPGVNGIIYWNLVDDTAHVNPDSVWNENVFKGGLLNRDPDLTPKPAFTRLQKLIRQEWNTSGVLEYQDGALNDLRGFYGDYEFEIQTENGSFTRTGSLRSHGSPALKIALL